MEFTLPFFDYIKLKGWKSIKPILLSVIIGVCVYYFTDNEHYRKITESYHNNLLTILEILIGFAIAVFTILLSIDNANVKDAKEKTVCTKFYSKSLSLWDSMLVELGYTIIIQGVGVIANLIYPLFVDIFTETGKLFFSINISLTCYSILVLLRSVLSIYLILLKR
ncbi:MAG: hypothetical protein II852_15710 [Bacteroidales bacterium]|jgi:mannose/fructose/N-acetylgalactosamine-specific phosphotransferase system component IIC|nr:hypothetical protein [Bacteroidales bacterium]